VTPLYWIGAILTLLLAAYLFVALFEPEKF
jgi:K+-transporting ATPase KdpF subunit